MDIWLLLYEIMILLFGALVLGGIFSRFGQSPLVGYLLAGMILGGPGSIHAVKLAQEIDVIAELGVSLLLFSIGLEFSFQRLKQMGRRALLCGALQVIITCSVIAGGALLFGLNPKEAIATGAILSLSSTAIVLRVLSDKGELESPHGTGSVALLLVQDVAVVPLSVLLRILAGNPAGDSSNVLGEVGKLLAYSFGLVVILYVLLTYVAARALGSLTLQKNRELTVVLAAVVGFGSTWAAHGAGISPALGAFVAGMLLGSTEFSTQIRADISALRVLFLTLFFGAAGMVADPLWILSNLGEVLLFTGLVVATKVIIIWAIYQASRSVPHVAATTGLCTGQVGEFGFVLCGIAAGQGLIGGELELILVSVTITSLFISPFILSNAPRLGEELASLMFPKHQRKHLRAELNDAHEGTLPHVIIVGFGPVGQAAASVFQGAELKTIVVDLNYELVKLAKSRGFSAYFGDASFADVLEHVHVDSARAVIVTIPYGKAARLIASAIKQKAPHVYVVVRSRFKRFNSELEKAGADVIFNDEQEVGLKIGLHLTEWLGELDLEELKRATK